MYSFGREQPELFILETTASHSVNPEPIYDFMYKRQVSYRVLYVWSTCPLLERNSSHSNWAASAIPITSQAKATSAGPSLYWRSIELENPLHLPYSHAVSLLSNLLCGLLYQPTNQPTIDSILLSLTTQLLLIVPLDPPPLLLTTVKILLVLVYEYLQHQQPAVKSTPIP